MTVMVGGKAGRSSASVEVESQMTGEVVTKVGRAGLARLIRMGAGADDDGSGSEGMG